MSDEEWNRFATNLLKVELARAGIGYDELIKRLDAIGVQESYKGLAAKINRGTFSLVFFAQCMKALGVKSVRLSE
jgi:DNA (cytosine-5)-methyltransferase 1